MDDSWITGWQTRRGWGWAAWCATCAMLVAGCRTPVPPVLDMVAIQGGTFRMVSDAGDPDERPVNEVTFSDFLISRFEVTQAVYQRMIGPIPPDSWARNFQWRT